MSRMSLASYPFLLGFEQLDRLVERAARSGNDGFPPCNIEQRGEDAYRITLAVAGYPKGALSVTVEGGNLLVRGRLDDAAEAGREFLHRGIAGRAFQRSFLLADRVEVIGAGLDRGLLHIDLKRTARDEVVRRIAITTPADPGNTR